MYKSATDIVVTSNSAYTQSTEGNLTLSANLYTGYVSSETVQTSSYKPLNENTIIIDGDEERDGLTIQFIDIANNGQLEELMERNNALYYSDLFNIYVDISELKDATSGKVIGYNYNVFIELRNEFKYRYIEKDIKFKVLISAKSDPNVSNLGTETIITFTPTPVARVNIENYPVQDINVKNTYQQLIKGYDVESAILDPTSKGSILLIPIQPKYSYFTSAKLKTSRVYVPSLGREVGLKLIQLSYNKEAECYETIFQGNDHSNDVLELKKITQTSYENDEPVHSYDGYIYVYVQLEERFGGLEATYEIELELDVGTSKPITEHKYLTTSYLPDVALKYSGKNVYDGKNLVQQNTHNNVVELTVYGYQFNSNPTVYATWDISELKDEDKNFIFGYVKNESGKPNFNKIALCSDLTDVVEVKDEKGNVLYVYGIADSEKTYLIGDYVATYLQNDYTEVREDPETRSYTMDVLFSVSKGTPAPFKINANLSLITKNGVVVSDDAEATFYPTDYILNEVYIKDIINSNKNLVIGNSTKLELGFVTDNRLTDNSEEIYARLLESLNKCEICKEKFGFQPHPIFLGNINSKIVYHIFRPISR